MVVNGKELEWRTGLTVEKLLQQLSIDVKVVVVEVNGKILEVAQFSQFSLNEADHIEVISFVGGG